MLNQILNQIEAALIAGNYSPEVIQTWKEKRAYCSDSDWYMYMYDVYSIASFLRACCGITNDTEYKVILDAVHLSIKEQEDNMAQEHADFLIQSNSF